MDLVGERDTLDAVWRNRDAECIARYQAEKITRGLDGLPGLPAAPPV